MGGYHLGIDFGTARTAAVLAGPDGRREQLMLEPSAVCLDNAPHFAAGLNALEAGRANPDRLEPHPRSAADRGSVILGGVECSVRDLFAAVLSHVASDARRIAGAPMSSVALTHPASWQRPQRQLLERAASQVGLRPVRLVAEPLAAVLYADEAGLITLRDGECAIVCDFGAGSFDAALVQWTGGAGTLLSSGGLAGAGGLALDAAVLSHLGATSGRRKVWRRKPDHRLLDAAREGREELSTSLSTVIPVPWSTSGASLERSVFEAVVRPLFDRAMDSLTALLSAAGVNRVAAALLTGGVARTPLVPRMMAETLGLSPIPLDGAVIAEGALLAEPSPVPRKPRKPRPDPVGPSRSGQSAWSELSGPPRSGQSTWSDAFAAPRSGPPAMSGVSAARGFGEPASSGVSAASRSGQSAWSDLSAPSRFGEPASSGVSAASRSGQSAWSDLSAPPSTAPLSSAFELEPWAYEAELASARAALDAESRAAGAQYRAMRADLRAAAADAGAIGAELTATESGLGALRAELRAVDAELGAVRAELGAFEAALGPTAAISEAVEPASALVETAAGALETEPSPPESMTDRVDGVDVEDEPVKPVAVPGDTDSHGALVRVVRHVVRAVRSSRHEAAPIDRDESQTSTSTGSSSTSTGSRTGIGSGNGIASRTVTGSSTGIGSRNGNGNGSESRNRNRNRSRSRNGPGADQPAGEAHEAPPFSDVAVSPAPKFPAPNLTLADLSSGTARPHADVRPERKGPGRRRHQRRSRWGARSGLMTILALLAIAAGVLVALKMTGAMPEERFQVGKCVAQDADRATVVDCDARGAFEITEQLSRTDRCPDVMQPFVVQGQARFCLVPASKHRQP